MRDIQLPGRSVVYGTKGVAATSQPLATQAALKILQEGGNAVDAAIAASAMLCVVEPFSTGIGGDCFAILSKGGSGNFIGLNGSGRAPAGLNLEALQAQGICEIDHSSPHAVTVPGAIDAWARLMADHGRLGLDHVLQSAIEAAENGYAVTPVIARSWQGLVPKLDASEGARRHFTLEGRAPAAGERFAVPALGRTLRAVAKEGARGFYEGAVGEDMVSYLSGLGGFHTLEDFKQVRCDYVDLVSTDYGAVDVCEIPPNGQGITALIMLNILSHFDIAAMAPNGAERIHVQVEAQRLAFELRDRFVADPNFAEVPVEALLSKQTAARLAARIDPKRALDDVRGAPRDLDRDTVYLSVIDEDLNVCSFINSLYYGFGGGLAAPNSAVMFQNRGLGFSMTPGHPNVVAGGKRPKHTIIPGMLRQRGGAFDGKALGAFGVMGGDYQPMGHTQVVLDMQALGMDAQEALDAPRYFFEGGVLSVETGVGEDVVEALRAKGHCVERAPGPFGGGQIALIDWQRGSLLAASEPRKDGLAGAL
ncbi:MAG: gamma-glutamyltransferase family protein [Alphaproteobacteria bacterium]|nr:MAG: gamma-glutamyltransferase family protein [Alphaproteobacteria bacterium]